MSTQKYSTAAGRINKLKGEILAHAMPVEVLGITGQQKKMPKNSGDNVVYRRWLPFGGVDNVWIDPASSDAAATFETNHITTEGVTPSADTLTPVDVTSTLQQYSVLYALTDKTVDLYEDDVPEEMKKQTGERLGLVREMVRYGAIKGGTNKFYAGGTSRSTVDEAISINFLRKITRSLRSNHAKLITSILSPSPNFGTAAIEASYLVFCHTDCDADIRDLPGFTSVADYGSRKPVHELECGSVENFRFILSPELVPIQDAGAAVGTTGLYSTSAVNIDIYPMLVVGEDAWGQLALRGMDSIDPTYIPPGQKDKNDPLGQRGYIGAKTYFDAVVLNNGWLASCEVGVSAL